MTYEPPAEGTPEDERPAGEPVESPTPAPETPDFEDEEAWADDEFAEDEALSGADDEYLAGDDWRGGPPFLPPPTPPAKSNGLASTIAVLLLALGLLAATAWGVKLHRDKLAAASAAGQLLSVISEGAPAEMVTQLSAIQANLTAGKITDANDQISTLRTAIAQRKTGEAESGTGAAGGSEPIPEQAYKDLTPDAAQFFRANQGLFRRFLMMCNKSRDLRDKGQNVDALRKVRDEILEAARLGQKALVQQKMIEMLQMLGTQMGGKAPGAGGANPLAAKAEVLRGIAARAQAQGRDLRAVSMLMQKASQAAQAGNKEEAGKLLDQAIEAARNAPRASGADRRRLAMAGARQGPGMGQNPLAPFVRALLGVMGAEEGNLRQVSDDLMKAHSVLFSAKPPTEQPDLLKPLLDNAMTQLTTVAARRKELQKQAAMGPGGKRPTGRQGTRIPAGQAPPEDRKGIMETVRDRVGQVLDAVRLMTAEEYTRDRKHLVDLVLQALLNPPTPEEQAKLAAQQPAPPPGPLTAQQRADAVRAKMVQASPVLRKWELAGKDTQKVEDLFAQARKDLYANKLDDAEKSVNEALTLLGLAPPPTPAKPEATVPPIKFDLRSKP